VRGRTYVGAQSGERRVDVRRAAGAGGRKDERTGGIFRSVFKRSELN